MRLADTYITQYPKLQSYVENDIAALADVPLIVNAIKKFSGQTSMATIRRGLSWGTPPHIKIVPGLKCGGSEAYGCYAWGSSNIQIDYWHAQSFEVGADLRPTRNGTMVHRVGVILLHELTHWADAQDGIDDVIPDDPSNEEGHAFEREVYGHIIW